jgi:hypothetical protein
MNDDDQHVEADERDERTAALLEVPPLDDVTRRRLVRRALAESAPAPARGARFLRVAAVVVGVVAIGGAAVLVARGGDGTSGDAARTTASEPGAAEDRAGDRAGEPETLEAAPATGDLGEVPGPEELRRRLAAFAAAPPGAAPSDEETTSRESAAGLSPECLATLDAAGAGAVSVAGSATYQGVPALVVVASTGKQAFVLDQTNPPRCPLLATVPLV